MLKSLAVVAIAFLLAACVPGAKVEAPSGNYVGVVGLKHDAFLGIPYAKPPVGNLRWRPTESLPRMSQTYMATLEKPGCLQGVGFTGVFFTNEDCLYLNIWRPKKASGAPVMVYIHGGSGDIGAGNEPQYEGNVLASDYGVIVVNINARLGLMGFLTFPDLTDEGLALDGVAHSGNYNFLDQLKALEWVHDNIASFGGDPNNVTLFGESAGGISTCMHLASPMSVGKGYFHKAIIQSGSCEFKTASQVDSDTLGQNIAENVMGCPPDTGGTDTLDCMRKLSGFQLYERNIWHNPNGNALDIENRAMPVSAIVDNFFIPNTVTTIHDSIIASSNASIPVIIGNNLNEGTILHAFEVTPVPTVADYNSYIVNTYDAPGVPGDSATINTLYPVGNYTTPIDALSDIDGDKLFACPGIRTADALSDKGHDVYYYELHEPVVKPFISTFVKSFNQGTGPTMGAFHSSDIPFVFGTSSVLGNADKKQTRPTMKMMMEYWTSFARNGVPASATAQGLGVSGWTQYDSTTRSYAVMQNTKAPVIATQNKQTKCNYWNANRDSKYFDVY